MEVRFAINYDVKPSSSRPCIARVTLMLPQDTTIWHHPNIKVFGIYLNQYWGIPTEREGEVWRRAGMEVDAPDWASLNGQVNQLISSTVDLLRDVVRRNTELMSAIPPAREEVFAI